MIQTWVIVGLALSAAAVSILGATFSVVGLGKLFAGAIFAVWLMAGSLELAKFVVAAYLHQTWKRVGFLFKVYLVSSVVILSSITSLGIFGFLSDAYTTSSSVLEGETIRLQKLENEKRFAEEEIKRISSAIDEIPDKRITKKMAARAEAEPIIRDLQAKIGKVDAAVADAKIKIIDVKQKVGPLIYISKAFNLDIDTVVKYLIMVFVSVFDPLAICLVIALSDALAKRSAKKIYTMGIPVHAETKPEQSNLKIVPTEPSSVETPAQAATEAELAIPVLKMRFADDTSIKSEESTEPQKEEQNIVAATGTDDESTPVKKVRMEPQGEVG